MSPIGGKGESNMLNFFHKHAYKASWVGLALNVPQLLTYTYELDGWRVLIAAIGTTLACIGLAGIISQRQFERKKRFNLTGGNERFL